MDGMTGPTNIQIGGIELVGSRWLPRPLSDAQKNRKVVFDVKVRNNKDDAATYQAPFDVPNAVGGNATRREQSPRAELRPLAEGGFGLRLQELRRQRLGHRIHAVP